MVQLDNGTTVPNTVHKRPAFVLFLTAFVCPGDVGVATKSYSILGPDDADRRSHVIATIMEVLGLESVQRSSIYHLISKLADEVGKLEHF